MDKPPLQKKTVVLIFDISLKLKKNLNTQHFNRRHNTRHNDTLNYNTKDHNTCLCCITLLNVVYAERSYTGCHNSKCCYASIASCHNSECCASCHYVEGCYAEYRIVLTSECHLCWLLQLGPVCWLSLCLVLWHSFLPLKKTALTSIFKDSKHLFYILNWFIFSSSKRIFSFIFILKKWSGGGAPPPPAGWCVYLRKKDVWYVLVLNW